MAEPNPPVPTGETPDQRRARLDDEQKRLGSAAMGAGMTFVGGLLLFSYLGQWVDRRYGTAPWGLLIGVFVGAGGAFYSLYTRLTAAQSPKPPRREDPPSP
jgi:F0F1-type ATP synthase assembly protein I